MSQESYYLNGMASFDEDAEAYAFIATENPLAELVSQNIHRARLVLNQGLWHSRWERVLAEVTLASDGYVPLPLT